MGHKVHLFCQLWLAWKGLVRRILFHKLKIVEILFTKWMAFSSNNNNLTKKLAPWCSVTYNPRHQLWEYPWGHVSDWIQVISSKHLIQVRYRVTLSAQCTLLVFQFFECFYPFLFYFTTPATIEIRLRKLNLEIVLYVLFTIFNFI